jgi:hypothetical protein
MQDDFDSGMGMPDDELAGGSAMSDIGDAGLGGAEGEGEGEAGEKERQEGQSEKASPESRGQERQESQAEGWEQEIVWRTGQ